MSEVNVLAFGAVTDIVGKSSFALSGVASTGELKQKLEAQFPALKNINYVIAVNKQMVTTEAILEPGATVALLPPFSGG